MSGSICLPSATSAASLHFRTEALSIRRRAAVLLGGHREASARMRRLGNISRHLCQTALGIELANAPGSVDVPVTQIEPDKIEAVTAQIEWFDIARLIHALAPGQVMVRAGLNTRHCSSDHLCHL